MAIYSKTNEDVYVVVHEKTGQTSPPLLDPEIADMSASKLADKTGSTVYVVKIVGIAEPDQNTSDKSKQN